MAAAMVVLFASSFRLAGTRGGEESPNIDHVVRAGSGRTLCGRRGRQTEEGPVPDIGVGCLRCRAVLKRAGGVL